MIYVAVIDACSERTPHDGHLRQPMWPREDGEPHDPRWLWCLGHYDQQRQNRRVIIRTEDRASGEAAELVGEGLSVVGSAHREPREPGACGECREPEDFDWHPTMIVDDGPVIVCHMHGELAPGWAYEGSTEVGIMAYLNPERLSTAR